MKILVAYASAHGSTAEVAAFIGRVLDVYSVDVTVAHADTVKDISDYDVFLLGSAIHSSMWLPSLSQLMFRFEDQLREKPIYMWLNCIIVMEEGGEEKARNTYVWDEALTRLNLSRDQIAFFPGKLNWDEVDGDEKWVLSSRYEGKKLPGQTRGDYRDWQAMAEWVHQVAKDLDLPLNFEGIHQAEQTTKDETVTEEDVQNRRWPDNPGEGGAL